VSDDRRKKLVTEQMKRIPEDASDWTIPDGTVKSGKKGLNRRTVVAGAAWSVPVIAAAIATPLAAASVPTGEPTVRFTQDLYETSACVTLTGVVVQATTDGTTPAAGGVITVTLPPGFTWADGTSAARNFVADASGNVTLPGIVAPATGGRFDASAVYSTATDVAAIQAAASENSVLYRQSLTAAGAETGDPVVIASNVGNVSTIRSQQNQASSVAFMADGNLYAGSGRLLAENVQAYEVYVSGNVRYVVYSTPDGVFKVGIGAAGAPGVVQMSPRPNVRDIKTTGDGTAGWAYLSSGQLRDGESDALVATGVTSFEVTIEGGALTYYYATATGIYKRYRLADGTLGPAALVRAVSGATQIRSQENAGGSASTYGYMVGTTLYSSSGAVVATGVSDYEVAVTSGASYFVYTTAAGVYRQQVNATTGALVGAPVALSTEGRAEDIRTAANAGQSNYGYLINGNLYAQNGNLIDTGVTAFETQVDSAGNKSIFYAKQPTTCA
jgi:hypothetical protein